MQYQVFQMGMYQAGKYVYWEKEDRDPGTNSIFELSATLTET